MSDQSLLTRFRARRSRPEEPRSYRLANSVRLPVLGGILVFAVLAMGTMSLVGKSDRGATVPAPVLDYQEAATRTAAQSIRRGVNEGIDDLDQMAAALAAFGGDGDLDVALKTVAAKHGRYAALYIVDVERRLRASHGSKPAPDLIPTESALGDVGMLDARRGANDAGVLIRQFAPISGIGALVGHYDAGFLRFPLEAVRPGDAWLVNRDGRVIASLGGGADFGGLPSRALRDAARRGASGDTGSEVLGGGIESQEVIAWAPVAGNGPAGDLGWTVVSSRRVTTMSLPETDARRQGILVGALIAFFAALVFGWLWLVVVKPVLQLQKEAERIAYGDLSRPVEIVRYDEIGLTARALERVRVLLIRRRVQGDASERK